MDDITARVGLKLSTCKPCRQAAMAITQDDILEMMMRAEREAKRVEYIANYTLKVPRDNTFLRAGLRATEEYYERDRQTKNRNSSDISTNFDNNGSLANYVALEWMKLWIYDENARNQLNDILGRITSPKDLKSIFLVAQTKLTKNKDQGIIHIRMNSNYSQLEDQLINEILTN
jgi:hypothetical protein